MNHRFQTTPPLSMTAQATGLRHVFPNGEVKATHNELRWRGELSPDEYSRTYVVEMRYRRDEKPLVWVRTPDLHPLTGGRRLPHVYDDELQQLCLFFPRCGLWHPARALSQTILPWTCYWLRLFELWIVTDDWHERGVHPAPKPRHRIPPGTPIF